MTRLDLDEDLNSRVHALIERGLEAYGSGDLEAAMSYWKLALALDPDSRQASDYVAYVKRHFQIVDEGPVADAFAAADAELEVPFGLTVMGPTEEFDFEAFESLASGVVAARVDDDFGEEQPTRITSQSQPTELDQGWSFGTGDFDPQDLVETREHKPVPRPTYEIDRTAEGPPMRGPLVAEMETLDDIETGGLADALEPDDDDEMSFEEVTTQPLTTGDDLEEQLAAVTEGLLIAESGAIEETPEPVAPRKATVYGYRPPIEPSAPTDPTAFELEAEEPSSFELEVEPRSFELEAEEPSSFELEAEEPSSFELEAEPRSFELEAEEPSSFELEAEEPSAFELEAAPFDYEDTPATADIEAPAGLDLGHAPAPGSFPDPRELAFDLGPVPDVEATPLPPELGPAGAPEPPAATHDYSDDLGLDLELGKAGKSSIPRDVNIRFREPSVSTPGLEDQLAELENEMRASSGTLEWQAHEIDRPSPRGSEPDRGSPALGIGLDPLGSSTDLPPADPIHGEPVAGESPEQQLRRRIEGYIQRASLECSRGNYAEAAAAADRALAEGPDSAIAQKLVHQSHGLLVEVFRSFLGDLDGVPAIALPMHEISMQELDHRTAFLLSRIDGTLSFEDILDVSGMPRLEALRYLCKLRLQGILEVR